MAMHQGDGNDHVEDNDQGANPGLVSENNHQRCNDFPDIDAVGQDRGQAMAGQLAFDKANAIEQFGDAVEQQ